MSLRSRTMSRALIAVSAAAAPVVVMAPTATAAPTAPLPVFPQPTTPEPEVDELAEDSIHTEIPAAPAQDEFAPLTETTSVTRYLAAQVGNVRSGPGLQHRVVTTMTRGTKVTGTWVNGWLNIGGGRYLSETILTANNPNPQAPTTTVTRWVSVPAANVRSGPSTNHRIVGARTQGQQVSGTVASNGWVQIGSGQFMSPTVLTSTNPAPANPAPSNPSQEVTRWVSPSVGNVRSGPGLQHRVVTTMTRGTKVTGTWVNGWLNIGGGRYLSETILTATDPAPAPTPPAATVTRWVSASVANVRSGPSTNHSIVGTRTLGTEVSGTLTSNGWLKMSGNQYMSPGVLTTTAPAPAPAPAPPAATVTRWVSVPVANVRSGPSTNYSIVGTRTQGQELTGTLTSNGWLKMAGNQHVSPTVVSTTAPAPAPSPPSNPAPPAPTPLRESLLATAAHYVGSPYVLYGTPPHAFDCSSYTWWIYKQNGIEIPRTVAGQRDFVIPVTDPQPGDLVFYKNWYHVGIYAGPGMSYEAQNPSTGVIYGPIWSTEVWYGRVPGM